MKSFCSVLALMAVSCGAGARVTPAPPPAVETVDDGVANETRTSVDFGVGLATPIPLSITFGFPIPEEDGDDAEVFSFRLSFR